MASYTLMNLLTPCKAFLTWYATVSATNILLEGPDTQACVAVNARHYSPYELVMTFYFEVSGRCPALAVPFGFSDIGVPTGIQIVAKTYDDAGVFRIANALEQTAPLYGQASRRPDIAAP